MSLYYHRRRSINQITLLKKIKNMRKKNSREKTFINIFLKYKYISSRFFFFIILDGQIILSIIEMRIFIIIYIVSFYFDF